MRVTRDDRTTKLPPTITFSVTDPITLRDTYRVVIDRKEAEEAIDYLKTHNGNAPEFVHAFIHGMEIALTLKVRNA